MYKREISVDSKLVVVDDRAEALCRSDGQILRFRVADVHDRALEHALCTFSFGDLPSLVPAVNAIAMYWRGEKLWLPTCPPISPGKRRTEPITRSRASDALLRASPVLESTLIGGHRAQFTFASQPSESVA
jgi:hypothetical protein